jgi:hypothetical protein
VFVSLLVTFIFNKVSGLPKQLKDQKDAEAKAKARLAEENSERDKKIAKLEEAVKKYPEYRSQSLKIQDQLQCADNAIVELCKEIKNDVIANGEMLNARLSSLERREKNSLRAKILAEYRLYTDEIKNPMQAWSEMEHHSFFKLVEDYESLGGNDYVHGTILPAMNELDVIPMDDLHALKDLYSSRNVK